MMLVQMIARMPMFESLIAMIVHVLARVAVRNSNIWLMSVNYCMPIR
jgi:hypothetical protein